MSGRKKIIFDEKVSKRISSTTPQTPLADMAGLPANQKQALQKEAYKEALKEVYKEQLESKAEDELVPEKGNAEGILQQKEETAKKRELVKEKVDALAQQKKAILFTAKTFFPFDLFPDTVIVDSSQVTIVTKEFFFTDQVESVPITAIFRCEIEHALFLANLIITYMRAPVRERMKMRIEKLKHKDALQAKELINGLAYACSQGIDLTVLNQKEIMDLVAKVGKNAPVEERLE